MIKEKNLEGPMPFQQLKLNEVIVQFVDGVRFDIQVNTEPKPHHTPVGIQWVFKGKELNSQNEIVYLQTQKDNCYYGDEVYRDNSV